MKKIISTIECEGEGLEALLGEHVIVFCMNYHYAGTLVGVNDDDIILSDASIVYETGPLNTPGFTDAQKLPTTEWRVRTQSIESYGVWPC